jgi:hypothetical protein
MQANLPSPLDAPDQVSAALVAACPNSLRVESFPFQCGFLTIRNRRMSSNLKSPESKRRKNTENGYHDDKHEILLQSLAQRFLVFYNLYDRIHTRNRYIQQVKDHSSLYPNKR